MNNAIRALESSEVVLYHLVGNVTWWNVRRDIRRVERLRGTLSLHYLCHLFAFLEQLVSFLKGLGSFAMFEIVHCIELDFLVDCQGT